MLALAAAGCGNERPASAPRGARSSLVDLGSVDQLRERFTHDRGHPRLLLLLSPT